MLLTPVTDIMEGFSRGENFIGDLIEVVIKQVVGGLQA
jgi:hypothetical protein